MAGTIVETSGTILEEGGRHRSGAATLLEGSPTVFEDAAHGPALSDAALPATLAERFEIVRELVAGDPSRRVVQVTARDGGRQVVLKIVRNKVRLADPAFVMPMPVDGKLALPFEQGQLGDGRYYELQPFVSGSRLSEWLDSRGPIGENEVLELARELSRCLDELARHEPCEGCVWVHCDLKPENVIVVSESPISLVLLDFGSAIRVSGLSVHHERGRTIAYSAPELAYLQAFETSDCWSIGMILYQAFLGRHPMIEPTLGRVTGRELDRICSVQFSNIWQARSTGAPASIAPALEGCLTAAPLERWSLETLSRFLRGDPVTESPAERERLLEHGLRGSYQIGRVDCATAEDAASACAGNWSEAVRVIQQPSFLKWLRTDARRPDLADSLEGVQPEVADDAVLRFIYRASPRLPPVWRGHSLLPEDLAALAGRFLQGGSGDEPDLRDIKRALQYLAWAKSGFVNPEPCGAMEASWTSLESACAERMRELGRAGMPVQAYGALPDVPAMSLLAASDPTSIERLRERVRSAFSDNTPRASWFFSWGRDVSRLDAAQVMLLHALRLPSEANTGLGAAGSQVVDGARPSGPASPPSPGEAPGSDEVPQEERVLLTYRFRFRGGLE